MMRTVDVQNYTVLPVAVLLVLSGHTLYRPVEKHPASKKGRDVQVRVSVRTRPMRSFHNRNKICDR